MWLFPAVQTGEWSIPSARRERHIPLYHRSLLPLAALFILVLSTPRALPGFNAPLSFDAGIYPYALATGDFNHDGIPDLVVANRYLATVSVLLGKGNGQFAPAVNYPLTTDPNMSPMAISVTVADLNGDGIPDLAVPNPTMFGSPGTVSILLGKGDGTFQAAQEYPAGITPRTVAVGDFNGDGIPDLAIADEGTTASNYTDGAISVLLGKGDGTFQPPVGYAAGSRPTSVVAKDFNGDGFLDLAVCNYVSTGTVSVFLGKGDGTFQDAIQYPTGSSPYAIAVGDFNADGIADMAVADLGADTVSILIGNGDGSFRKPVDYAGGGSSVAVADINGDGIPDLAVAGGPNGVPDYYVSILLGKGDGTFQPRQTYPVGDNPISLVAGDFNGDGKADVAVANNLSNDVSVLLGIGGGALQAVPHYAAPNAPVAVAVQDLNGDGILDVVTANAGNDSADVLLGQSDGTFQKAVSYPVGTGPQSVVIDDFNHDGIPDLAVAFSGDSLGNGGGVRILLGKGDGTLKTPAHSFAAGMAPAGVAVGDFNGDGIPDLAVANNLSNDVSVLLGNGDGTFQAPVSYAAGPGPASVAVADFNHDGHPDLVVANSGDSATAGTTVSILLGNGDGTFQAAVDSAAGNAPYAVVVADFNGDGIPDLAVVNALFYFNDPVNVSILLGNGDGTFQQAVGYAGAGPAISLAVADFNGDRIPDLAITFMGGVGILLGQGDGTFKTTPVSYIAGSGSTALAVADFNGDGHPDLAVANSLSNDVSILLNDGNWAP